MLSVIVGEDSLLWRVSSRGGGGRVGESTGLDNLKTTSSSSFLIGTVCSQWSQVQILEHPILVRSQLVWLRPVEILNLVMFIHLFV